MITDTVILRAQLNPFSFISFVEKTTYFITCVLAYVISELINQEKLFCGCYIYDDLLKIKYGEIKYITLRVLVRAASGRNAYISSKGNELWTARSVGTYQQRQDEGNKGRHVYKLVESDGNDNIQWVSDP